MKYQVTLQETHEAVWEVEANSANDALSKAMQGMGREIASRYLSNPDSIEIRIFTQE
jgi:hypothetical protein